MQTASRQVAHAAARKAPLTAPTGRHKKPRVRANSARPSTPANPENEAVFSRGEKYAGEKGGFRVYREKGKTRRFILRARRAREAILSAAAAEEAAATLAPPPVEAIPATKPARKPRAKPARKPRAKPARKPRAKKAASE